MDKGKKMTVVKQTRTSRLIIRFTVFGFCVLDRKWKWFSKIHVKQVIKYNNRNNTTYWMDEL